MATFYAAVEGDPLNSGKGSYVTTTSQCGTVKGEDGRHRRLVFLGDTAYCAACKSTGVIVRGAPCGDSGRMIDLTNAGRRQAVGGDKVACKCPHPPSIIAVNGRRWMIQNDGDSADASSLASMVSYSSQATSIYDEQVHSSASGVTLAGYPYLIEAPGGQTRAGRLDASGKLPRIDTGESSGEYTVYWGDEALAKQSGA
jgi:hypothetical protein